MEMQLHDQDNETGHVESNKYLQNHDYFKNFLF